MKNPVKTLFAKKPTTAAEIEAELGRLQQKLADHQRRRSEALQALAEAQAGRRQVLAEEQDVIDQHSANVRSLTVVSEDLAAIISEYEVTISDAETRLRDARTQENRRAEADRREAAATKVEMLAQQLQKDVAALARTTRAMIAAIPTDVGLFPAYHMGRPEGRPEAGNDMASPREAVAASVIEALFGALPEIVDQYGDDGYRAGIFRIMTPTAPQPSFSTDVTDYKALSAEAAVAALITGRLRERAAEILAGEVEPRKSMVAIVTPYRRPPAPPEVDVVGLKHFHFLSGEPGFKPQRKSVMGGSQDRIPEKAAKAAIDRGYAALPDSAEGVAMLNHMAAKTTFDGRGNGVRVSGFGPPASEYADLGDPLGLLRAWEQSKREVEDANVERQEVARALG